jgi:hypothetical protein
VSAPRRFDWPAIQRCLWRLHRDARPFLGRSLLIGGGACLFYRATLRQADDPDFQIPLLAPETEQLWLSKDLDFTGIFSGDAVELLPHLIARDPDGREFIEVEGVRLGFAQVGLVLDPELAMETARTAEFEWEGETVQFLVADPVTLYREKQALVERRNQPGDSLHLALLGDYVAWEITTAAERLLHPSEILPVTDSRELLAVLTDAARRLPGILHDPRIARRLAGALSQPTELATTIGRLLQPAA